MRVAHHHQQQIARGVEAIAKNIRTRFNLSRENDR
jgi:hypothetical protein